MNTAKPEALKHITTQNGNKLTQKNKTSNLQ